MAGIVVDPSLDPPDYEETGGEFVPNPAVEFYRLKKNGAVQEKPEFESWDLANAAAQGLNNGYDQVDKNQWEVFPVVPSA